MEVALTWPVGSGVAMGLEGRGLQAPYFFAEVCSILKVKKPVKAKLMKMKVQTCLYSRKSPELIKLLHLMLCSLE